MSNCKAGLHLNHFWINVKEENDVIKSLESLLEVDLDLSENEDEFREDTIELGYENEVERIVAEYIKSNGVPNDIKSYKAAAIEISDSITEQEYYGVCNLSFVAIDQKTIIVAFATGGATS